MALRVTVVTVSTAVARAGAEDRAGRRLAELLAEAGHRVDGPRAVADDAAEIRSAIFSRTDTSDAILTLGGTGLTRDDVTPDVTRQVIEREAPGIAEALRAESTRQTPMGMLTRGTAGMAGRALIVNLPGSAKAVDELWAVLAPVLEHAVALVQSPGGSRHLH
jgi:molybdenum cofactor synthesis domain-containing protein